MKTDKYLLFCLIIFYSILLFLNKNNLYFLDSLHISNIDNEFKVYELSTYDIGSPLFFIRIFHNKLILFVLDFISHFVQFFDFIFLINMISLIGLFGLILGLFYMFHDKRRYAILLLSFLLSYLALEIIFSPNIYSLIKLVILIIPLEAISIYGISNFLQYNKLNYNLKLYIFIVLGILSVGWILVK